MNPTFYIHVAVVTALIILVAFILGTHPFKKKSPKDKFWLAGDYYTFLRANIQTCMTFEELEQLKNAVDGFYNKTFREPISRAERSRYYTRLMETIYKRENEMEGSLLAGITSN
jgi:hypothetical protein